MLNKLRERAQGESGFTLIELLVVMLIIGLLAAIAIPSFFNQRDKANDADAKEQVRTAQTAAETFATDSDGSFVGLDETDLTRIEPSLSNAGSRLAIQGTPTANSYAVRVTAETTNNWFQITNTAGTLSYTCETKGDGGCPSDGFWD